MAYQYDVVLEFKNSLMFTRCSTNGEVLIVLQLAMCELATDLKFPLRLSQPWGPILVWCWRLSQSKSDAGSQQICDIGREKFDRQDLTTSSSPFSYPIKAAKAHRIPNPNLPSTPSKKKKNPLQIPPHPPPNPPLPLPSLLPHHHPPSNIKMQRINFPPHPPKPPLQTI